MSGKSSKGERVHIQKNVVSRRADNQKKRLEKMALAIYRKATGDDHMSFEEFRKKSEDLRKVAEGLRVDALTFPKLAADLRNKAVSYRLEADRIRCLVTDTPAKEEDRLAWLEALTTYEDAVLTCEECALKYDKAIDKYEQVACDCDIVAVNVEDTTTLFVESIVKIEAALLTRSRLTFILTLMGVARSAITTIFKMIFRRFSARKFKKAN